MYQSDHVSPVSSHLPIKEENPEDILQRMKAMEARYAYENELMAMIRQGKYHRANLMLSGFSAFSFEQRVSDRLRNMKNYVIISNTIMRKAAEQGGVHPVYLDAVSSQFSRSIENMSSLDKLQDTLSDMLRSYCRLVRNKSTDRYSVPVQEAMAYIECNLSGDLSLQALSKAQNISPGYLSALFRKDLSKTLTAYVTEQRMETGAYLLRDTRLQVQAIAQYCGISDVNYFSKLFKKHAGMTPLRYRQHTKRSHQQHKRKA